jgi:putative ABC transport system permease protein
MFKNYFKIAIRNIKRNSTYSILNISGMAIGMASAILILLWVQDEWSYDRHFRDSDNLYRVLETRYLKGGKSFQEAITPSPLAAALKKEYPEIIRSSRYLSLPIPLPMGDEFVLDELASVDKDFFELFNLEFVRGDINSALTGPHDLVLTEEMANKYFGKEDPLGKTLTIMKSFVFTVTGVVKSLPQNSHIKIDFLVPFEFLTDLGANINDWGNIKCFTYIQLYEGTDKKIADKKILDFLRKDDKKPDTEIFLQNIKKIHLFSSGKYAGDISGNGDITNVRILSLIAVFILIIACINFMNLSTAQSVRRAKEIGLRKVVGATKLKIVIQFLGEALLIVLAAYIIAMIIVELLLPVFSNLIGKQLVLNYKSAGLYVGLIIIVLFCGLMAGSYPAFYLSSLKPLNIIKGNKNPGNARFRRVLVILQFSLSVLLIICTIIVGNQLKYLQNKKLGLNIDNIGYFQFSLGIQRETLKKDLCKNPDIVSVTIAEVNTFSISDSESDFSWEGKKEGDDALFRLRQVDEDYATTFQLEVKEGRFFSSEFSTDNTGIVINEKAGEILGFKDPVGEILTNAQGLKLQIIGVVRDFHFKSLHTKIEPLILYMKPPGGNACFIRMRPDKITSTVEYIKKTFKSYNLPYSCDLKFLDDEYCQLYRTEQKMGNIFGYFSLLAIIISCLGLIGLSLFITELRTKETGIRKVNGAKSLELFLLLSKEYIILVIVSFLIACPVGWYMMHKWLQNFAYRVVISWWVFAIAGVIAFAVALLTVGFQTYRAAGKNPVEALRYE